MNISRLLEDLRSGHGYAGQLVHVESLEAREAQHADPARPLPDPLARGLGSMGIERLYAHQVEAIDAAREGRHTVVVTSTASGKTLCYNLPVLEALLGDPSLRALYLFPTKALAQDQHRGLLRWKELIPGLPLESGTYDGDTPGNTRRKLRDEANVILSNPDMLHSGILPNHGRWAEFFAGLRYVVLDEIHVYRGVFGSNVASVLRRLDRVCRHYGSSPVFVCCSATIANPKELAEKLTDRPMRLVDRDGSPRGAKTFLLWNPPVLEDGSMERRSTNVEAAELLSRLVAAGHPTIAFVRARVVSEVVLRYTREMLERLRPSCATRVRSYRGGYLPAERREIEKMLFSGDLLGVVSTSALEVGIDVGALEAAVLVGYPGSVASTWQRAGRAGRGLDDALVILVGQNAPIDQYLMRHPRYLFGQSPEAGVVDPSNPHLAMAHLRSAVFELPLTPEDLPRFGDYSGAVLEILEEDAQVRWVKNRWYWTGEGYPAADIGLRTLSSDVFTIVDTTDESRVIGTIDEPGAHQLVHDQAIYMHEAETYFVQRLDLEKKAAFVEKSDMDYYTQSVTEVRVKVDREEMQRPWRDAWVHYGDVSVTHVTFMFRKIKFGSRDSLGYGSLDLPPLTLATTGLWLTPGAEILSRVRAAGRIPHEGLLGAANAVQGVLPLYVLCDTMDVNTTVNAENTGVPSLYVYDKYPGGLGFARKAYDLVEEILTAALDVIEKCSCRDGCPSCVGSPIPPYAQLDPDAGGRGSIPDKEAAIALLRHFLGREPYEMTPADPETRRAALEALERSATGGARRRGPAARAGAPEPEGPEVPRPPTRPLPAELERKIRESVHKLKRGTAGGRS
jgi:DEAD/DEAH box helicase domain-containing protein